MPLKQAMLIPELLMYTAGELESRFSESLTYPCHHGSVLFASALRRVTHDQQMHAELLLSQGPLWFSTFLLPHTVTPRPSYLHPDTDPLPALITPS